MTNSFSPLVGQRQWDWLKALLQRQASTLYGRRHSFQRITTPLEYQEQVPLTTYEDLAPLIDKIAHGEQNILFSDQAVAFEKTGGSLSGPKLIPYSNESLENFRGAVEPWLNRLLARPEISGGTAYWATSHRNSGATPAGVPIGLPEAAYLGKEWARRIMDCSAVPAWVGDLSEPEDWRLATLYWLLRAKDLFLIWVWSPTFFLSLLNDMENSFRSLHDLLAHGGRIGSYALPPDREALKRLENFGDTHDAQSLWPKLERMSAWAEASSKPFAEAMKQRFPKAHFEPKGLLLTEGIVTIPNGQGQNNLAVDWGFFEFIDDHQRVFLAQDIVAENEYEVILTTAGGLYRYRTGDRVRCEGFTQEGPVLTFQGRESLTSDLVGEKLTEPFVEKCLDGIPGFRMLVPTQDPSTGYVLVVETTPGLSETQLDDRLCRTPSYAHARRHYQLAPVRFLRTLDPLKTYMERLVAGGVRRGDVKSVSLRRETDWVTIFKGINQ